jgi:hypothetical protein
MHERRNTRLSAAERRELETAVANRNASTLHLPLHPDISLVAQCRRGLLRQPRKETAQTRRFPVPAGTQRCHPPLRRRHQRKPRALYLDQGSEQNHRRRQARAPSVRFDPLGRSLKRHSGDENSFSTSVHFLPESRFGARSAARTHQRIDYNHGSVNRLTWYH